MALFDSIRAGASGASTGFQIERSLRLDGTDGYLTRTPSSTGNRKVWTWSGWVKRSKLDNNDYIFSCNSQSGNDGIAAIYWKSGNNKLQFYFDTDGSNPYGDVNDRDYRDVTNWYHIVWQVDAENTTHRIWVNGVEETITGGQPPNYSYAMNRSGYVQAMGSQGWDSHTNRGHMYFAECHYSDGNKYEASDFGEIDSDTGVWSPKENVNINYGTNGFYLKFDDNSNNTAATIGKDSSGNGNNWTPVGIVTGDSVKDSPTNNFCTLNVLSAPRTTLSNGALETRANDGTWRSVAGTFHMTSGKWYWEGYVQAVGSYVVFGLVPARRNQPASYAGRMNFDVDYYPGTYSDEWGYESRGYLHNSASPTVGWGATYTTGDIIGVAYDADNGTLKFYKNNSQQGSTITGISTTKDGGYRAVFTNYSTSSKTNVNFGQDSSFAGHKTAQGNTDGGGQGDFYYAVPSGYKALCAANLPDPAIVQPSEYFNIVLWSGNNSSGRTITGVGFQPDWVWLKCRSDGASHQLHDAVRGANKIISSNKQAAESNTDEYGYLSAFATDGFTLTNGSNASYPAGSVNMSGRTYVAWNWKAGDSTVTNNDGSTSSQVRANTTAGFSIVSYTGTGSNATVGHGLGVAPDIVIVKNRTDSNHWNIYHAGNGGNTPAEDFVIYFSGTNAKINQSSNWNDTAPTSSVFSVGSSNGSNGSSDNMIAYCFSEVEGYSKFGAYGGNGDSNGAFVYLGFRPRYVVFKRTDSTSNWNIRDTARDPVNETEEYLLYNSSEQAGDSSSKIDFLSNGFKHRNTSGAFNSSSGSYIYLAFAENPFKYARAR